jgi:hypothetical protein
VNSTLICWLYWSWPLFICDSNHGYDTRVSVYLYVDPWPKLPWCQLWCEVCVWSLVTYLLHFSFGGHSVSISGCATGYPNMLFVVVLSLLANAIAFWNKLHTPPSKSLSQHNLSSSSRPIRRYRPINRTCAIETKSLIKIINQSAPHSYQIILHHRKTSTAPAEVGNDATNHNTRCQCSLNCMRAPTSPCRVQGLRVAYRFLFPGTWLEWGYIYTYIVHSFTARGWEIW